MCADEMGMWMPCFVRYFWIFSWSLLTPALVLAVIITSLVGRGPDKTEGAKKYTLLKIWNMALFFTDSALKIWEIFRGVDFSQHY